MSIVKIKDATQELRFSFNSFNYMQDFDAGAFEEVEQHPFKIVPLAQMLTMGAMNFDPKHYVDEQAVQDFIESYCEDNSISDLITMLVDLLQESSFFKSLQKTPKTK